MTSTRLQLRLFSTKAWTSSLVRQELALGAGIATCLVFVLGGERTLPLLTNSKLLPYTAVWLFLVMLWTSLSVVMNGMVGFSLLLGGWRHREQHYHLPGANAYLSVIIPLAVMSLIMPDFTLTTPGPTLSADQQLFLFVMTLGVFQHRNGRGHQSRRGCERCVARVARVGAQHRVAGGVLGYRYLYGGVARPSYRLFD